MTVKFAAFGLADGVSKTPGAPADDGYAGFDKDQLVHQKIGQDHFYAVSPRDGRLLEVIAEEPYEMYTAVSRRSNGLFTAGYEVSIVTAKQTTLTAVNIATSPTCLIDWVDLLNVNLDFKSDDLLDVIQLSRTNDLFVVRGLLCRSHERTIPGEKRYSDKLLPASIWYGGNSTYFVEPSEAERLSGKSGSRLFGWKTTHASGVGYSGAQLSTNLAYELSIADKKLDDAVSRLDQQLGRYTLKVPLRDQISLASSLADGGMSKRALALFFSGIFHQYGRLRGSRLIHSTRELKFKWKD